MTKNEQITDDTMLVSLSVGQLREVLAPLQAKQSAPRKLKYGLKGIQEIFNCGLSRAQELKNTIIKDAISQDGRTIIVDEEKAITLFEEHTKKHK